MKLHKFLQWTSLFLLGLGIAINGGQVARAALFEPSFSQDETKLLYDSSLENAKGTIKPAKGKVITTPDGPMDDTLLKTLADFDISVGENTDSTTDNLDIKPYGTLNSSKPMSAVYLVVMTEDGTVIATSSHPENEQDDGNAASKGSATYMPFSKRRTFTLSVPSEKYNLPLYFGYEITFSGEAKPKVYAVRSFGEKVGALTLDGTTPITFADTPVPAKRTLIAPSQPYQINIKDTRTTFAPWKVTAHASPLIDSAGHAVDGGLVFVDNGQEQALDGKSPVEVSRELTKSAASNIAENWATTSNTNKTGIYVSAGPKTMPNIKYESTITWMLSDAA